MQYYHELEHLVTGKSNMMGLVWNTAPRSRCLITHLIDCIDGLSKRAEVFKLHATCRGEIDGMWTKLWTLFVFVYRITHPALLECSRLILSNSKRHI
jgi:hypothetical protein